MKNKKHINKRNISGEDKNLELYIHIPFCVRKCLYCDFLSAPSDAETRERYVKALLAEIRGRAAEYEGCLVTSVFFGGGTPSLLEGEQLKRLLAAVRSCYRLAEDAEITVEVNPGTADGEKLKAYRTAGVNRLSIGLQSAHNEELKAIGRIHTWEQFLDTFQRAREEGFNNINVDLMSALPGQSLEAYMETLDRVAALVPPPEHISAYSLILEEGTPLFAEYEKGRLDLPDEDTERLMYQETKRVLETKGYRRYEISNYAKDGCECRHNCGYWQRRDYLGLGIGAASLTENVRFRNGEDLWRYLEQPLGCREELQALAPSEQMEEFMFLGLRLTEGVSCGAFEACFGETMEKVYGEIIEKNIRDGLLFWYEKEQGGGMRLALTDRGLDLSNYVMRQFLLT